MQKSLSKILLSLVVICLGGLTALGQQRQTPQSYIELYKNTAQQLMQETGVPASVILGIAIHESAFGTSRIARHLNNHFGIKGKNSSKTIKSAYKGYESTDESYRDFIDLLKRRKATQTLFGQCSSDDYNAWIAGIARAGYSVSTSWRTKILTIIAKYNLDDYDI
jgi:flagellum-specific peptidoglycan hydrolase FlgJ